jgi:ActD protein
MAASTYGLIAIFETPAEIYAAAKQVRDAGYQNWDCITPCPIHGLDQAMGLRRSIVPRYSLTGGITGFCTGMSMIWYMNGFDYTLTVGGKPFFSPLFAFPVSYELTILFTAFATIGGMFFVNGLTKLYHPVLKYEHIVRGMDDRFFIVIETSDPRYHPANTRALLERAGGRSITELED